MYRSLRTLLNLKYHVNRSIHKRFLLKHSINHIMNKKVLDRYLRLPLPCNKVLATYIWIDGSGINMRCKDRVLNCVPCSPEAAPLWAFDGSSTGQATTDNSDTTLKPAAVYRDPFRGEPHVLVLCEVYQGGGSEPASTNHRKFCNDLCEIHRAEEPWFGLEQEYTMLDVDGWGLGWPKGGGFPAVKYQYSYCGVGAKYVVGRDISEAHEKACLYAGLDFEGTNAEVMFGCWEWQIGTSLGIKGPDDLWASRFIMGRVAEDYGVDITYHPKPMGVMHPGVGMHHNFSTIRTRSEGGYQYIEECMKKLEANHMKHMKKYSNDEATNRMRMSGKFEAPNFDKFSWGIASRKASVRLQRSTKEKGKGFFEDRRPGGDCDPYLVCGMILETCLGTTPLTPPSKPKQEIQKTPPPYPGCFMATNVVTDVKPCKKGNTNFTTSEASNVTTGNNNNTDVKLNKPVSATSEAINIETDKKNNIDVEDNKPILAVNEATDVTTSIKNNVLNVKLKNPLATGKKIHKYSKLNKTFLATRVATSDKNDKNMNPKKPY